jgi:uncharacterized protein (DUF983 family)
MPYCKYCGEEYSKNQLTCPNCGAKLDTPIDNKQVDGNILWLLVGIIFPIVGFILYLVWKNDRPKDAKYALVGLEIMAGLLVFGFVLSIVVGVIYTFSSGI